MLSIGRAISSIFLSVFLVITTNQVQSAEIAEKAAMQVAMQQHIDRNLVNGAYLHLDMHTGMVHRLYPLKAHPMILRMGDYFVLCSDFKDVDGKSVNVDFYVARNNNSYTVFHSAVDDRVMLKRWIGEGTVERLN